jgi:hypothetical protein
VESRSTAAVGRPSEAAADAGASSAGERMWLYQAPSTVVAVGPSGQQRSAVLGTVASDNSTSFWVGCEGSPAVTEFTLDGQYSELTSTLALDSVTPADLAVHVSLTIDAKPTGQWDLRPGLTVPIDVPTAGGQRLTLRAQATAGVCGVSSIGYGIAFDAALRR